MCTAVHELFAEAKCAHPQISCGRGFITGVMHLNKRRLSVQESTAEHAHGGEGMGEPGPASRAGTDSGAAESAQREAGSGVLPPATAAVPAAVMDQRLQVTVDRV